MATKVQTIPQTEIAKQLNENVFSVLKADALIGFEKAYLIATAAGRLKELLTPEYLKPILDLQGNRLGFKTDLDTKGGYPAEVVKNCLIEAVLMGVQPFGNQFNIISSNCYITKEGFGYLLANYAGLSYKIVPELPRMNQTSAAVKMNIEWTINGVTRKESLDIPVKLNQYMGTDAVIGKATRKARAWLYNTITGSEIPEGDAVDVDAKVVGSRINSNGESEAITIEDLQLLFDMKKPVLSEEDVANATRILDNKEEASYLKLLKLLQAK
jgi:hypothetical protein